MAHLSPSLTTASESQKQSVWNRALEVEVAGKMLEGVREAADGQLVSDLKIL